MALRYTENLIPIMTSNTTPSGVASASSTWGSLGTAEWNAFSDKGGAQGWLTSRGNLSGWLCYKFDYPTLIKKYVMTASNSEGPRVWFFEGSNDNNNYTVLDQQSVGINAWTTGAIEFSINNNNHYLYYRIRVLTNEGGVLYLGIRRLQMMGTTNNKHLIKQNAQHYTINSEFYNNTTHNFTPLILTGGDKPNLADYGTFGFDDVNLLANNMTKGTDTFKIIDKLRTQLGEKFEIVKCIKK
ncbi:hypothetical protein [Clostridium estertheticum]|uniref:hypothetical protein n=1 Tax=Clostridium estertheticum TaxID=238834 RepID=UPI001C0C4566|nr:hypothetical protein [Clostridium estertheticum]MBU3185673.1 hypothetical protein [Clostridium estertheticum]